MTFIKLKRISKISYNLIKIKEIFSIFTFLFFLFAGLKFIKNLLKIFYFYLDINR